MLIKALPLEVLIDIASNLEIHFSLKSQEYHLDLDQDCISILANLPSNMIIPLELVYESTSYIAIFDTDTTSFDAGIRFNDEPTFADFLDHVRQSVSVNAA
jgi:hypothetical protein